MRQFALCAVLIAATSPLLSTQTQNAIHPTNLNPSGSEPIHLVADAHRTHLLGAVSLYSVALYARRPFDRAELLSSEVPKALRFAITYDDDLRLRVPFNWRDELVPRLDAPAVAHLRGTFAPLRRGDIILIEYAPGGGTSVRVNKSVAVSGASHDLVIAFVDHWLGQRPLSEEIKHELLSAS